ncbi:MAG: PLDc N-terminal domain-containing protein [Syntrophaceticus sp.]|nr:PLDc N-terminal domain-containing protein [Syntrophaceticus sp.]MDD4782612.1 PLDc N-terminal domain-containing protein [Syntrophaceticus sp.]
MEFFEENILLVAPLIILQIVLFIIGIVDLLRRESQQVRWEIRWPWVIILLINIVGPLIYFAFGRKD